MDPTFPSFRSIPSPPRENEIISFLFDVSPNFFLARTFEISGKRKYRRAQLYANAEKIVVERYNSESNWRNWKKILICVVGMIVESIFIQHVERERKGNWWDC